MTDAKDTLYAAVWRWHGIAGLLVVPLLLTSALTGGIYLYRAEVDAALHPAIFAPPAPGPTAPLSRQVAAALAAAPGTVPINLAFATDHPAPTEVLVRDAAGAETTVVVDPTSGAVRGALTESTRLTSVALRVHSDLYAGFAGRVLLELGACWGLVLVITGVFLWWPRGRRSLLSALRPKLAVPGAARWREVHAVLGAWFALPIAMLIITGLPWSAVWGDLYGRAGHAAGAGFPDEVFWWRPAITDAEETARVGVDRVWAAASAKAFPRRVEIHWPRRDGEAWLVRGAMGYDPQLTRYAFIDPATAAVMAERTWEDVGSMARPVGYGVALHMGLLFGEWNRLLSLSGVVGVIVLAISAPVLWWKRRPGRTGIFPPAPDLRLVPRIVWVPVSMILAFLPVAALSAIAAALLSWSVRRWCGESRNPDRHRSP